MRRCAGWVLGTVLPLSGEAASDLTGGVSMNGNRVSVEGLARGAGGSPVTLPGFTVGWEAQLAVGDTALLV